MVNVSTCQPLIFREMDNGMQGWWGRMSVADSAVEERWVEHAEALRQLVDMATSMCIQWRQQFFVAPAQDESLPRVVS